MSAGNQFFGNVLVEIHRFATSIYTAAFTYSYSYVFKSGFPNKDNFHQLHKIIFKCWQSSQVIRAFCHFIFFFFFSLTCSLQNFVTSLIAAKIKFKIFLCFPTSNKCEEDIKFAHFNFCFSLKLWFLYVCAVYICHGNIFLFAAPVAAAVVVILCVFVWEFKQNFIMMLLFSHFEWKMGPKMSNAPKKNRWRNQGICTLYGIQFCLRLFFFPWRSSSSPLYRLMSSAIFLPLPVTKSHNLWNNDQKLYQHYAIVMGTFYAMHVFFWWLTFLCLYVSLTTTTLLDA